MEYLIIALINLAVYFRTIFYGLVVDDIHLKGRYRQNGIINKWRPFNVYQKLYGAGMFNSDKLDHALTLTLHTIVCCLIYKTFGANYISFIASILYAIHPVNLQTAVWLNGRRYVVNIILVLLMWLFRPFGFLIYPFTLLFQINAILSPLLLVTTKYWYFLIFIAYFSLIIIQNKKFRDTSIYVRFKDRFSELLQKSEYGKITWKKLIIMVKSYGYFTINLLVPYTINFYVKFLQKFSVTNSGTKKAYSINLDFWKGIAAIIITSLVAYLVPQTRLYIFWYVLFILVWLNFMTSTQICADRYTALASIGLLMTVAYFVSNYPIILGLLTGYYLAQNIRHQKMYKNIDNFYFQSVYENPESVLGTGFYVRQLMANNLHYQALTYTLRGLHYNPKDYRLLINYARILGNIGYIDQQQIVLKQCEEVLDDTIFQPREVFEAQINQLKEVKNETRTFLKPKGKISNKARRKKR